MDYREATETLEREARAIGLHIEAKFVPLSQSRNAKEKLPTVNWKIKLWRGFASIDGKTSRLVMEFDYSQGSGHLKTPQGFNPRTAYGLTAIESACERGHARYLGVGFSDVKAVPPTLTDVLSSLLLDASALDEGSFEEWASSLGYDPDSRKAEAIWQACVETGLKLRSAFGDETLQRFSELAREM